MNREKMIEWLINNDIALIQDGAPYADFESYGDFQYIADRLRDGFVGYSNQKNMELAKEILRRDPNGETHDLCALFGGAA